MPLGTTLDVVKSESGTNNSGWQETGVCGGYVMRQSNRMKRILRDQWREFLASTPARGR
jgi:hypothetical protein